MLVDIATSLSLPLIFHSHLKCRLNILFGASSMEQKPRSASSYQSKIEGLKERIKQKCSPLFDKFVAADLILWKVCYF